MWKSREALRTNSQTKLSQPATHNVESFPSPGLALTQNAPQPLATHKVCPRVVSNVSSQQVFPSATGGFVSECNTTIDRDEYVTQLLLGIPLLFLPSELISLPRRLMFLPGFDLLRQRPTPKRWRCCSRLVMNGHDRLFPSRLGKEKVTASFKPGEVTKTR